MPSERLVEPYTFERVLPHWLIHTWDRTAAGIQVKRERIGATTAPGEERRAG